MDALMASYADISSDSEADPDEQLPEPGSISNPSSIQSPTPLPPPPVALLDPPNSFGAFDYLQTGQASRVRSFPHIEGNYALHVYIPVRIPLAPKKELLQILKKVTALLPGLQVVDVDIPLSELLKDDHSFEKVVLGREFHISLGRTVPIKVHQRDTMVTMLRQRFQSQKSYWIDFNKWEVFINDEQTRTFLSLETTSRGLAEITKQIQAVNGVYRLHNLPEFYKDPRPHISLAWSLGDSSDSMKRVIEEEIKRGNYAGGSSKKSIFACKFSGIMCKIGNKSHEICKCGRIMNC